MITATPGELSYLTYLIWTRQFTETQVTGLRSVLDTEISYSAQAVIDWLGAFPREDP